MDKLKYYTIFLDGIDKCGKDTIRQYVWRLDKRLNVFCRGWPSLVAYARKFCRDCHYELPDKHAVYVHLHVNENDWKIRCEMTNEPVIDYFIDTGLFNDVFAILDDNNYQVIHFNTSKMTPIDIAKAIVNYVHRLNLED